MTCAACGTENPERARFCIACGASLAAACPTCGEPIVEGARFCAQCGTSLTGPGATTQVRSSSAAAERRVCSILFCDLVGFTPIAEARDPEVVRELLSQYFETARLVIGRYGGTVEKFIGDAVMAVWGAPAATEDDAERAVRAALELVDAVDALAGPAGVAGLAARAGVVTGEVAVTIGAVGQGMVAGDPVNTAARVQTAAAVDEVLMDDTTARLVRAAIEVEDAGARPMKGKAQGQHLWRAVRVLANVGGVQRIDGLEAPLIGRDLELRLLKDLFHTTITRSSSRLALVTGEAGSGKSRLGWEFEKYVDGLSDAVWWHRSRCLSYGDGVAFWALTEMVRQRLGIAEEDPPEVALPLLIEGLDRFLPAPDERGYVGVRLGRLLGVRHPEDDGRSLEQSELFAGWRTWLVRLADTAPVVWVIEDLQFADSGLLDFLDHVLDWTRTAPIHLVGLARPDIEDAQPGWTHGRHRQQIDLEPLDGASMARLLDALVPGMPGQVVTAVSAQAHGVPLFAVETVRSLIDDDLVVPIDGRYRLLGEVGTLAVPETLRAVLAARLDHLDSPLRDLLATAGVLGTTFPAEALAAVADRSVDEVRHDLEQLVARGLITVGADPLSPQRGSYAFTHDLLRRVAVETLSRHDRRARHLKVAEHLRSVFPDDGEEVADVIARHLLDAVEAVPDAPSVSQHREDAVAELIRAAARARTLGAPRRAGTTLEQASRIASDEVRALELLTEAARARLDAGDSEDALRIADSASARCRASGQLRRAMTAEVTAGLALSDLGQYRDAGARVGAAVEVLRISPDLETIRALCCLSAVAALTGVGDAHSLIFEAMGLAERHAPPTADLAYLFGALGFVHSLAHESFRALAAYRECVRLAESVGSWGTAARALGNMAGEQVDFEPAGAVVSATLGLGYARRAGFAIPVTNAIDNLTQALVSVGRWDDAAMIVDEAERLDGLGAYPLVLVSAGRLAGLRGDGDGLDRTRRALDSLDSEDEEIRCYAALLGAFANSGRQHATQDLEAAQSVLLFRSELGVNFSAIREAWVIAARAASRIGPREAREILEMLSPFLPTELCPMLRAERLLAEARLADEPEPAFEAAIAAQRADTPPHLLAHGLLDWAEHRIAAGLPDDAVELIDEAIAIADRLGAAPIADRAAALRSEPSVRTVSTRTDRSDRVQQNPSIRS